MENKTMDQLAEQAVQNIEKLGIEFGHIERELALHYIAKSCQVAEHQGCMRGIDTGSKATSKAIREVITNG